MRTRLIIDAMGDALDFANVSLPHLLMEFQYDKDLHSVCFVLDVREVKHLQLTFPRFRCLILAIDDGVLWETTGFV